MHRIKQNGVTSFGKELKKREYVKLNENTKYAKPESMDQRQSRDNQSSHALLSTDSLDPKFASIRVEFAFTTQNVRFYDGPNLKLFILVGWDRSSFVCGLVHRAQLMIFFCFRFPVVLFGRPGMISICHATRCIC